ncbi:MAG TPA: hypothetical protein VL947_07265, partial [Cytophagales bacterium]|nr:hypothetical protein [Cytophagales bacterium]
QNWAQKMLAGDDKDQFEGPIGESLLPGPSVIYSRVVTKSIYNGASSPGFTVNEYYTVKDYPSFKLDYSQVEEKSPFFPDINAILVNISYKVQAASQNYTFITNDMHGKPRRTVRFGGNYPIDHSTFNENQHKVAYEELFDYYEPGKPIPVLNSAGTIEQKVLGAEEKIAVESKNVEDQTDNLGININTSVGYLFIAVLPQLWLSGHYSHSERKLRSAVSSKVVHYQSFLKGTTVSKDGLTYRTENRLFDRLTGDPIATVTTDEYNDLTINSVKQKGVYTNYTVPAHYVYPAFGLKSSNEGWSGTETVSATAFTSNTNISRYKEGDLISIGGVLCFVTAVNTSTKVVTFSVATTGTVSAGSRTVTIVNSGANNKLRERAGNILCYGNDDMGGTGVVHSPLASTLPNVVSASASVFTNSWDLVAYDKALYGTSAVTNLYMTGERGKWRSSGNYTFKASPLLASAKTYNTGYFAYQKFDYATLANNNTNTWIKTNQVTKYSPNGEVLEEENAIGVPSAAKFAHKENVPAIIAQNARFASILFASFEDKTGTSITTNKNFAHTGSNCVGLSTSQVLDPALTGTLVADAQVVSGGLALRYWTRSTSGLNLGLAASIKNNGTNATITSNIASKNLARVGDWSLFESYITFPSGALTVGTAVRVELSNTNTEPVYVDDYRVQPIESNATCYVYDYLNLRLLATFDDRHFAMIYQYDAEGKLVRRLIETERGLKTVSETQYNTPERAR